MRIETVLTPSEIDRLPQNAVLRDAVCVVFDVLRATTTMVTALDAGATAVLPVRTIEEALAERSRDPGVVLAGERGGDPIAGFDLGNSPLEFTPSQVRGRRIAMTTTNGTIALAACSHARTTIAASISNLSSVAELLRTAGTDRVVIVCAGTGRGFALEDAYAAGRLVHLINSNSATNSMDDATGAVFAIAERYGSDALRAFRDAANGRALLAAGRGNDVDFCAVQDRSRIVPVLQANTLVAATRCMEAGACR